MPTAGELLEEAERRLIASDAVEHPHRGKERFDAEEIMGFVLGSNDFDPDMGLSPDQVRHFRRLVARREGGEPPAYIVGSTEFLGLRLEVGPGAFIPRQSSEWMAQQALRRLRRRPSPSLVDLATGVGPVALAVARSLPRARVWGVDVAGPPLRMARRTAAGLGIGNATFLRGDLFAPLPGSIRGTLDVITVHPPYVGTRELRELPDEIQKFEPRVALTDESPLGDRIVGRVADEAPRWLRPDGWLLVEVSPDRSRGVATTLRRAGFRDVRSTAGGVRVSRVVVGRC
jgi:release factor glutamine methyltransferase